MSSRIMEELKKTFRPEFLNRVDEMVVFHPLKQDDLVKITKILIKDVSKRLKEQELELVLDDEVLEHLAEEGNDPTYGARPLRRAIQKMIEDPLSEKILEGTYNAGDTIKVELSDKEVVFVKPAAVKKKGRKKLEKV